MTNREFKAIDTMVEDFKRINENWKPDGWELANADLDRLINFIKVGLSTNDGIMALKPDHICKHDIKSVDCEEDYHEGY